MVFKLHKLVVFLLVLCFSSSLQAGRTVYKWRDENGQIHYSSILPPEYSDQGHEKLNPQAIVVDRIAAPKTKEQLVAEEMVRQRELERLAAEEEKNLLDRKLLATFNSEDDILRALEELVNFYQAEISLTKQTRRTEIVRLAGQVRRAAALQRADNTIDEKLTRSITEMRASVATYDRKLIDINRKMVTARESFDEDLKRYRDLAGES